MSEYIDREAANLALAEQGFDWDKVKQALASVPVADVVPVVRCKECKYRVYKHINEEIRDVGGLPGVKSKVVRISNKTLARVFVKEGD